ncbi:MAG: molybdopterin-dependent oxidoreductase [Burkholderiales bacterium]|nr:molybdopterin-dependent oxidoreductase [Burkholderiales bacterium]
MATRIESNWDIGHAHAAGGRVCVKAYGLIQKTYNPNRIRSPMKRTNPRKGRDQDPGFVPIAWQEAFDIVGAKLREVRARGLTDEHGFPRFAITTGGGGTPVQYMGAWPAFLAAWGPVDQGFGAGQGVKCMHSEHLYGEFWHRAFIVSADTPRTDFVINCGANIEASHGVLGIWREAEARVRGLRRIQVEPHMSVTGALSAEWVPIKPKTDAAFLFGLVHRILHERAWREVCDLPYLSRRTNSPYLVGPNGWFLRDPSSEKPLVWDLAEGRARPYDAEVAQPAMTGAYTLGGIEIGPDGRRWTHASCSAVPAFQKLLDHMAPYTPEWAAEECGIAAATIRRIADEYLAHARVGETVEIEGHTLPLRPVAVMLGKGIANGWGAYHCCWAQKILAILVGALEVPGGILGTAVKLVRPANPRVGSAVPGPDGFMHYQFNPTSAEAWMRSPHIRNAYKTLVPLVSDSPWSPALGPAHLPWLFLKVQPEGFPRVNPPDIWFCYRTNPAISSWNAPEVAKRLAEFPFIVAFAYTEDETNHFADVLLPESTDLESLQLIRIGGTKFNQNFWHHEGWALRAKPLEPLGDTRDMTDIATELARQAGILERYVEAINRGAAGMSLRARDGAFDYALDPAAPPATEQVWDAICKAASHDLSGGEEVHDLAWFREHGFMLRPFPELDWYLYPALERQGLRFELPYQERLTRHGQELAHRLKEAGIGWWEKQLEEYEFLPTYERFAEIWLEYAREYGHDPEEYPFWAMTARSFQYAWGANAGIPLIKEVADNVAGHQGVIVNRTTARRMGIADGDPVVIESVSGVTEGPAVLREGIRPDCVLMIGQFAHWKTPVAKDFGLPSLNSVTDISLKLTDGTGSGADLMRVKLYKAGGRARRA